MDKTKIVAEKIYSKTELLLSKIRVDRLLKVISKKRTKILGCNLTNNSYGEFLFIELFDEKNNLYTELYGLGYHSHRDVHLTDFMISNINIIKDNHKKICNKDKVINHIKKLAEEMEENNRNHIQSVRGNMISEAANIFDDDSVIGMM